MDADKTFKISVSPALAGGARVRVPFALKNKLTHEILYSG